jgi:glycosyltransferase involved in cell wall biosynthesis
LVGEIGPDLIHSHSVGTTLTMRLALGRAHPTPRIFQVPGPLHLEKALFRMAEIASAGPSDYWIASCQWTRDRYHRSGVAGSRVGLSYYGLDLADMSPRRPGKLRKELSLPPQARLVGMVAYMYAPKYYLGQRRGLKGHEDFADAVALCRRTEPDVVGVAVGGAWGQATAYEKRVQAYGRRRCGDGLIFLGTRGDVPDIYADLDVVVHPSHSENVGGAAESMVLGTPTVATRVGGLPDLVIDGETGWLAAARNPAELAGAILQALREPEQAAARAQKGQVLARYLFDVRRTAGEVLAYYQAILADGQFEALEPPRLVPE